MTASCFIEGKSLLRRCRSYNSVRLRSCLFYRLTSFHLALLLLM